MIFLSVHVRPGPEVPQGGGRDSGHLQVHGDALCHCSEGEILYRCLPLGLTQSLQDYDAALENGQLGMDVLRPKCDSEGDWAPVQCTGSDVCR